MAGQHVLIAIVVSIGLRSLFGYLTAVVRERGRNVRLAAAINGTPPADRSKILKAWRQTEADYPRIGGGDASIEHGDH
jgi:hypothetical protein